MKTLVAVNVLDSVNSEVYGSHCQEWFRLGRSSDDEFILFHPNRFSIDNARNQAAQLALQAECDYLYFIDDDIIISPNTYQSLKLAQADIAQALTFIRGYPFNPMMFCKSEDRRLDYFVDYESEIDEDGLVKCEAVGFSCVLIKVDLLKKIKPPYFVTGSQSTEDVYFCLKARQQVGNVKIVVDTKVPTGHLLHPEAISVHSREDMLKFYKKRENFENRDRGLEYLLQCKEQFQTVEK